MLPSSKVPSGMRTLTSRSTMTSYFRSEVDHLVVNTVSVLLMLIPSRFKPPIQQAQGNVYFYYAARVSVSCLDRRD